MRIIDADALKAWFLRPYSNEETYSNLDICSRINSAPTVDPVKHGYWSLNPYNREWDVCSACRTGTKRREYGINPDGNEYMTEYSYRYCPNCGAKMDAIEERLIMPKADGSTIPKDYYMDEVDK